MKIAPASVINALALPLSCRLAGIRWNRIRKTIEFLSKLSLKAEKNWHQNNGAKRDDSISGLDWFGHALSITIDVLRSGQRFLAKIHGDRQYGGKSPIRPAARRIVGCLVQSSSTPLCSLYWLKPTWLAGEPDTTTR